MAFGSEGFGKPHPWRWLRQLCPIAVGALCLWIVARQIDSASLSDAPAALRDVTLVSWIGALLATAVSFWALGLYDLVFHRFFQTGMAERSAMISGSAAIALGQVMGMGIVTGALVRWRILPDLSAAQASKISLAVALSFLACLAGLVGIMSLVSGSAFLPVWVSAYLVLLLILCILATFLQSYSQRLNIPALPGILRMTGLSALDTAAAATALYFLLPSGVSLDWSMLYCAYLLALSGALLTGTPGGVGPFELVLISCLPAMPEGELLAGILAFRAVYYALPAVIALSVLAMPRLAREPVAPATLRPLRSRDLHRAERSEWNVCRQNDAQILDFEHTSLAVVQTPQTLTALFDPIGTATEGVFHALHAEARSRDRWAVVYKCRGRLAAQGRRAGWTAWHIADEAVINPQEYTTIGPAFRQLRRKLRQAQTADVTAQQTSHPPMQVLHQIDAAWQRRNGGARGISMGRLSEAYLEGQKVYIAKQGTVIIGFISFHVGSNELCLDLMRTADTAPTGTMHMLVHTALSEAQQNGCKRVSLAAMPCAASTDATSLLHRILNRTQASGLRQFKISFGAKPEPLYALARTPVILGLGLVDLAMAIRRPHRNRIHKDYEEISFARPGNT